MSIATFILGQSGTGKSSSLRNLDPRQVLLIQSIKKPLPFRANGWSYITPDNRTGSIIVTDQPQDIINAIHCTKRPIVIIDDFQYVMANEFMRRSVERGFDKFTEIGRHAWDVLNAAITSHENKRIYILSHTEENDGKSKIKTIGKMLDEKITLEGMVTICLQTSVVNEQYVFMTKNNGNTTVKSPMGLFESEHVDNDLNNIDKDICDYYNIQTPNRTQASN